MRFKRFKCGDIEIEDFEGNPEEIRALADMFPQKPGWKRYAVWLSGLALSAAMGAGIACKFMDWHESDIQAVMQADETETMPQMPEPASASQSKDIKPSGQADQENEKIKKAGDMLRRAFSEETIQAAAAALYDVLSTYNMAYRDSDEVRQHIGGKIALPADEEDGFFLEPLYIKDENGGRFEGECRIGKKGIDYIVKWLETEGIKDTLKAKQLKRLLNEFEMLSGKASFYILRDNELSVSFSLAAKKRQKTQTSGSIIGITAGIIKYPLSAVLDMGGNATLYVAGMFYPEAELFRQLRYESELKSTIHIKNKNGTFVPYRLEV